MHKHLIPRSKFMATVSPEKVAELISTTAERRRLAEVKRQPFVDAGWTQYRTDVYTFLGDFRVDASYKVEDDEFELFLYTDPVVRERFDSSKDALEWFERLKVALKLKN